MTDYELTYALEELKDEYNKGRLTDAEYYIMWDNIIDCWYKNKEIS